MFKQSGNTLKAAVNVSIEGFLLQSLSLCPQCNDDTLEAQTEAKWFKILRKTLSFKFGFQKAEITASRSTFPKSCGQLR